MKNLIIEKSNNTPHGNKVIRYNGYNMKFIGDPVRDVEIKHYIDKLGG
jgi:nitric oxide synthase oxygenase domain/subunit